MNYTFKKELEDFKVNEILDESILSFKQTNILLCKLIKKNYTTERAVSHLAKKLGISRKNISYAGSKDKNAITSQYITITQSSKEKINQVELKDLKVEFVGFAKKELGLGLLKGNEFEIIIGSEDISLDNLFDLIPKNSLNQFFVPNYFDDQRFSKNNFEIGIHLLKGEFKDAIELLKSSDRDNEEKIKSYLDSHLNDYVGALKLLPKKILLFFMHSVQSRIFNELLNENLSALFNEDFNKNIFESKYSQGKLLFPTNPLLSLDILNKEYLPLVGWDSNEYNYFLEKYDINSRNFLIRSIPHLTLEETQRKTFFEVKNFQAEKISSEKILVKFTLGKGSYATIVLRQIFGNSTFFK